MVALSITPASVVYVSGPLKKDAIAGEAFTAGDLVAYDSSNGKWWLAQCDGTAIEAGSENLAMALSTADAADARVSLALPGAIIAVGAGVAGIVYVPGTTEGDLIPTADLASGNKVTPAALGIGSSQLLLMRTYNAGAAIA